MGFWDEEETEERELSVRLVESVWSAQDGTRGDGGEGQGGGNVQAGFDPTAAIANEILVVLAARQPMFVIHCRPRCWLVYLLIAGQKGPTSSSSSSSFPFSCQRSFSILFIYFSNAPSLGR